MDDSTKPWTYSHTQLSLYRLCPRRYWRRYIAGFEEKPTPAMAFSTHLIHNPIESWVGLEHPNNAWPYLWDLAWLNFLAEIGESDSYKDPIYNLKTAKRCLELYKESPVDGKVVAVEEKVYQFFGNSFRYVSKPDFVVEEDRVRVAPWRWTVDLKFTTAWEVKPLQPDDDQLLGQAITHGADGFYRVTFHYNKRAKTGILSGAVIGPIIERCLVDEALKTEWITSTLRTIQDIEDDRRRVRVFGLAPFQSVGGGSWIKNTDSCYAYGRECEGRSMCKSGTPLTSV